MCLACSSSINWRSHQLESHQLESGDLIHSTFVPELLNLPFVDHLAVTANSHKVEMDLSGTVILYSFPNDQFKHFKAVLPFTDGPMVDRAFLEPLMSVNTGVDRDVSAEMEHVIVFVGVFVVKLKQRLSQK